MSWVALQFFLVSNNEKGYSLTMWCLSHYVSYALWKNCMELVCMASMNTIPTCSCRLVLCWMHNDFSVLQNPNDCKYLFSFCGKINNLRHENYCSLDLFVENCVKSTLQTFFPLHFLMLSTALWCLYTDSSSLASRMFWYYCSDSDFSLVLILCQVGGKD